MRGRTRETRLVGLGGFVVVGAWIAVTVVRWPESPRNQAYVDASLVLALVAAAFAALLFVLAARRRGSADLDRVLTTGFLVAATSSVGVLLVPISWTLTGAYHVSSAKAWCEARAAEFEEAIAHGGRAPATLEENLRRGDAPYLVRTGHVLYESFGRRYTFAIEHHESNTHASWWSWQGSWAVDRL